MEKRDTLPVILTALVAGASPAYAEVPDLPEFESPPPASAQKSAVAQFCDDLAADHAFDAGEKVFSFDAQRDPQGYFDSSLHMIVQRTVVLPFDGVNTEKVTCSYDRNFEGDDGAVWYVPDPAVTRAQFAAALKKAVLGNGVVSPAGAAYVELKQDFSQLGKGNDDGLYQTLGSEGDLKGKAPLSGKVVWMKGCLTKDYCPDECSPAPCDTGKFRAEIQSTLQGRFDRAISQAQERLQARGFPEQQVFDRKRSGKKAGARGK